MKQLGAFAQGGTSRRRQTHQPGQGRTGSRPRRTPRRTWNSKPPCPRKPTDFTLPGRRRPLGKLHPLTQVTEDIVRSFRKIGFAVADGPEVEDEYHCFDALTPPPIIPRAIRRTRFICSADETAACCARTPPRCKSASWKSSVRPCASSCRAAFIAATIRTRRIIRLSSRSKAFTWTAE